MVFLACSLVATKDCCMQVYWYNVHTSILHDVLCRVLGPKADDYCHLIHSSQSRLQHNRAGTGRSGYTHALRRVACQITFLATTSLVSFRVWTFWDRNPSSDQPCDLCPCQQELRKPFTAGLTRSQSQLAQNSKDLFLML